MRVRRYLILFTNLRSHFLNAGRERKFVKRVREFSRIYSTATISPTSLHSLLLIIPSALLYA